MKRIKKSGVLRNVERPVRTNLIEALNKFTKSKDNKINYYNGLDYLCEMSNNRKNDSSLITVCNIIIYNLNVN